MAPSYFALCRTRAPVWASHLCRFTLGVVVAMLLIPGCGRRPDVPVDDAAEHLRKLALGYVQYAATNRGVGPANQAVLEKVLVERNGLSPEETKACFISPRDNQPFIVRWGQRPTGSGPAGPSPPKPAIIIAELNGANGTRYVADGLMSVKELPAAEVSQLFAEPSSVGE
jgi:hypothetical protein